jgi:hypothetical protein
VGSIGSHWSAAAAARYLSLLTLAPIHHSLHMTERIPCPNAWHCKNEHTAEAVGRHAQYCPSQPTPSPQGHVGASSMVQRSFCSAHRCYWGDTQHRPAQCLSCLQTPWWCAPEAHTAPSIAAPVQPPDVMGETRITVHRSSCPAPRRDGGARRRHTQHRPSQLLSSPQTLWGRYAAPPIAVPVQPLDVMGELTGGICSTVHRSSCPAP